MLLKEEKSKVIAEYATHEGDTGSPEVQIAILTKRINDLTEHLKTHQKRPSLSPWTIENGWSKKKPVKLCHEKGY